jgi:hypothetical protein
VLAGSIDALNCRWLFTKVERVWANELQLCPSSLAAIFVTITRIVCELSLSLSLLA